MSDTAGTPTSAGPSRSAPGLAPFAKSAPPRFTMGDGLAVVASLAWLALSGAFFLLVPSETVMGGADPLIFVVTLLAVFMPVAVIWIAASAAKSARIMREESARLQAAIDGMRQSYISAQQGAGMDVRPGLDRKLDEIIAAQRKADQALERISSRAGLAADVPLPGKAALPVEPPADTSTQPSLALGTPAEALAEPISVEDFTRALNFPENEKDKEGFRALRRALKDHALSGLIHAAQDVLTLLSEEGIYMDDLSPERARPTVWRKFAAGERGRAVADLGGVRDRSSLALAAGRMRQDPIFRDAVHHFLRKYDQTFQAFEKTASDADITAVAETRTSRAFMLLGRVSGTFD